MLQDFFVIKREIPFSQDIICYLVSDAGMSVGKFFILTGFRRWFFVFIGREQVFAAGFLEVRFTQPQTIDKVKVRAKRRQTVRNTANKKGKKVIALKFFDPFGKTGEFTVEHKDKGAQDLRLVQSRTSCAGIKRGKKIPDRIKIQGSKFAPGIGHGMKFF